MSDYLLYDKGKNAGTLQFLYGGYYQLIFNQADYNNCQILFQNRHTWK